MDGWTVSSARKKRGGNAYQRIPYFYCRFLFFSCTGKPRLTERTCLSPLSISVTYHCRLSCPRHNTTSTIEEKKKFRLHFHAARDSFSFFPPRECVCICEGGVVLLRPNSVLYLSFSFPAKEEGRKEGPSSSFPPLSTVQ